MTPTPRPLFTRASAGLFLLVVALAGCSVSTMSALQPYRMEVVQGNVVTQEMVANLKAGQTRDQVRNLLGSPMLTDIFHAQRWDYVFTIRRQGATPQQRRVTVFFEAERVKRFEAGDLPSEKDFVASIDAVRPRRDQASLELGDEQLRALPLPTASAAAIAPAQAASGPLRNYPPLEPLSR